MALDPDPDLDSDPNWAKILDPVSNSMYLDPQHWCPPMVIELLLVIMLLLVMEWCYCW